MPHLENTYVLLPAFTFASVALLCYPFGQGLSWRGEGGEWAQVDGVRGGGVRAECQEVGGVHMAEPE